MLKYISLTFDCSILLVLLYGYSWKNISMNENIHGLEGLVGTVNQKT